MTELQNSASVMPVKSEEHEPVEEEVGSRIASAGARRKRGCFIMNAEDRYCRNCGTRETTLWRRSKMGSQLLCNACGTYERLHDSPRPFGICQRSTHRTRRRVRRTTGTAKATKSIGSAQGQSSATISSRQSCYGWASQPSHHDGAIPIALSARDSVQGTMITRQEEESREYHPPIAPSMTSYSTDNMQPPPHVAFSHEVSAAVMAGPQRPDGRPVHMFQPRGYDGAAYNDGGNPYESRMSPGNVPVPIKTGRVAMNGGMTAEYGQCSCAECCYAHCGPQYGQWYGAPFQQDMANESGHRMSSDSFAQHKQYTKYSYAAQPPGAETTMYSYPNDYSGAMHTGGPMHYGPAPEFNHQTRPYFAAPEHGDMVLTAPYSTHAMSHYCLPANYVHTPIPS